MATIIDTPRGVPAGYTSLGGGRYRSSDGRIWRGVIDGDSGRITSLQLDDEVTADEQARQTREQADISAYNAAGQQRLAQYQIAQLGADPTMGPDQVMAALLQQGFPYDVAVQAFRSLGMEPRPPGEAQPPNAQGQPSPVMTAGAPWQPDATQPDYISPSSQLGPNEAQPTPALNQPGSAEYQAAHPAIPMPEQLPPPNGGQTHQMPASESGIPMPQQPAASADPYGVAPTGQALPLLQMPGPYDQNNGLNPFGIFQHYAVGSSGPALQAPPQSAVPYPGGSQGGWQSLQGSTMGDIGGGASPAPVTPPSSPPPPVTPPATPPPPGFVYVTDPVTGLPTIQHDPTYQQPQRAPIPSATAGQNAATNAQNAATTAAHYAASDALAKDKLALDADQQAWNQQFTETVQKWKEATDARDFTAAQHWAEVAAGLNAQKQQLDVRRVDLEEKFGYANSQRADAATNQAAAGLTGQYMGAPTLDAQKAAAENARQNATTQASIAYQAAQVALAQGNQAEAQRQFNISQAWTEKAGTADRTGTLDGQTTLAGRQQQMAEQQQAFNQSKDPYSWVQKAQMARGVIPFPDQQQGLALPQRTLSGAMNTLQMPARTAQVGQEQGIQMPAAYQSPYGQGNGGGLLDSPYAPPGLRDVFGGQAPAQFQSSFAPLSAQGYARLLPSERQGLDAALTATGTNPADYYQNSQQLQAQPRVAASRIAMPRRVA